MLVSTLCWQRVWGGLNQVFKTRLTCTEGSKLQDPPIEMELCRGGAEVRRDCFEAIGSAPFSGLRITSDKLQLLRCMSNVV